MNFKPEGQVIADYLVGHLGLDAGGEAEDVDLNKFYREAGSLLVDKLAADLNCNQTELAEILGCSPETISRWKTKRTRPVADSLEKLVVLSMKMDELPTRELREKYKYAMLLLTKFPVNREIKDPVTGTLVPIPQQPPVDFIANGILDNLIYNWEKVIRDNIYSVDAALTDVLAELNLSLEEVDLDQETFIKLIQEVDREIMEEVQRLRHQKLKQRLPAAIKNGGQEENKKSA